MAPARAISRALATRTGLRFKPLASSLHIRKASRIVLAGGVIAYPTEAVFGLGCLPDNAHAVSRILALKRRRSDKGLILVAASLEQVDRLAELPSGEMRRKIEASWPGPVTWVLQAKTSVSRLVTGGRNTVAIRVSSHDVVRELCRRVGSAIVSTSANVSGHNPARHSFQVRRRLGNHVDYIVPGDVDGLASPSKILDAASGRVLRS